MPLLYIFTLLFGLQFVVVHVLAEYFSLYWRYNWLDMPVHAFGGVLVALSLSSLVTMKLLPRRFHAGWFMIVLVLIIILGWEAFGIYREQSFKVGWLFDTSTDVLCGLIGFLAGRWFTRVLDKLA